VTNYICGLAQSDTYSADNTIGTRFNSRKSHRGVKLLQTTARCMVRNDRDSHLQLLYCVSFADGENMINAMSISQRTDNSYAFLMRPFRLFEYVTCLLVGFSIFLISIFTLPILAVTQKQSTPTLNYLCRSQANNKTTGSPKPGPKLLESVTERTSRTAQTITSIRSITSEARFSSAASSFLTRPGVSNTASRQRRS